MAREPAVASSTITDPMQATPEAADQVDHPAKVARTAVAMVDAAGFTALKEAMQLYDTQRETVIKNTRDIQKLAKHSIYSLHRGDHDEATAKLDKALSLAKTLLPIIQAEPTLRHGAFANCLEEWAEGMIFRTFLLEGRVPSLSELPILSRDEYLGGVLDFTGELNRYAIARATQRDVPAVTRCRDVTDTLFGLFLQFDFRNGALRQKFDALKYTLKKMETTLYELALTRGGPAPAPTIDAPAAPAAS